MAAKKSTAHHPPGQSRIRPKEARNLIEKPGAKDAEEKERMVANLTQTSIFVALLLVQSGMAEGTQDVWQSLAYGLSRALKAAADPVVLYVIGSPGVLASEGAAPGDLRHAFKKAMARLKSLLKKTG